MGWYQNIDILMRNAEAAGLDIDFDVSIGNRGINVHDLAEKLSGVVARNGDILYPGCGGQRSAKVIFDEKAEHGYRLFDAYAVGAEDRSLQEADFRAIVGLNPGEQIHTYNDELLIYAREQALAKRQAKAAALWEEARTVPVNIVQRYLKSRGITVPLPPALRAVVAWHPHERADYPTMIALVSDPVSGKPMDGVHLTALHRDGSGKAEISSSAKWTAGNIKGGIVRLAEPRDGRIAISEGIETALSFSQLTGGPAWSAMNAGNMEHVILPPDIRHVVIAADNDRGDKRGRNIGMRVACRTQERLRQRGHVVTIECPPRAGTDWNDVLKERGQ